MLTYSPKVIPIEMFPADWCLNCNDPSHRRRECNMLEYHPQPNGKVEVEACGCTSSVTAGKPGTYVIRVTKLQRE